MIRYALILGLLLIDAAYGQSRAVVATRVKLTIEGDVDLKNLITSYVSRELRALGDVQTVDDAPDYVIDIVAITNRGEVTASTLGYSLSVILKQPVPSRLADSLPITQKGVPEYLKNASIVMNHWIQVGPANRLDNMCKEIVAKIDAQTLEPARRIYENLRAPSSK